MDLWVVRGARTSHESRVLDRYLMGGLCACSRNREEMLRDSVLSNPRAGPPAREQHKCREAPQVLPPLEGSPSHGCPFTPS